MERQSLYPLRQPEHIGDDADALDQQRERAIAPEDRDAVLRSEEKYGAELYKVYQEAIVTATFYAPYFATPEGRKALETLCGDCTDFFAEGDERRMSHVVRERLLQGDFTKVRALAEASRQYFCDTAAERFLAQVESGEDFALSEEMMATTPMVLNPDDAIDKVRTLRALKQKVANAMRASQGDTARAEMERDVLSLYRKRINELIARAEKAVGADEALAPLRSDAQSNRNAMRYDKFVFGADAQYDDEGWRPVITEELLRFADTMEWAQMQTALYRDALVRDKGLDPEKVFARTYNAQDVARHVEDVLSRYNLKSAVLSEQYAPDRRGPAKDDRWQVVIDDVGAMSVNGIQKVVKIPRKRKYSVVDVVSIACAHEVEGHVLQHENKSQLPLELLRSVRGDRAEMYAEAGAMYNQNRVSENLFGYGQLPHPHYARALVRRSEGSDYAQCVQAFFESAMKVQDALHDRGKITEEEYATRRTGAMQLAVNRVLRLFRGARSLEGGVPTHSKELVYLEQLRAMDALEYHDATQYVFVSGMTVASARVMKKWGLLDGAQIVSPQLYSKEVWNKVRDAYALSA